MHDDTPGRPSRRRLLTPGRRRWAWVTFAALLLYAPLQAYLVNGPFLVYAMPSDSWLLSATVAGLVGFVLIVDDNDRRRAVLDAAAEKPVVAEPTDD